MSVTFHALPPSANSACSRCVLKCAGIDFEEVNAYGQTRTPEYLAKFPTNLAPALEQNINLEWLVHEIIRTSHHQLFGSVGSALATFQILRYDFVQIINAVKVNILKVTDFRLDIARYGNIYHEHRFVAALLEGTFDRALAKNRQLAGS